MERTAVPYFNYMPSMVENILNHRGTIGHIERTHITDSSLPNALFSLSQLNSPGIPPQSVTLLLGLILVIFVPAVSEAADKDTSSSRDME